MTDEGVEHKRLLMELEKALREINRAVINPLVSELHIDDLRPVLTLVARARGAYLKELFEVVGHAGDGLPSLDGIKGLHRVRVTYEELLAAANALETAIGRGYLDIRGAKGPPLKP